MKAVFQGLIMAGGKGTRLSHGLEKPLTEVAGRAMIQYPLSALGDSKLVSDVHVAVSRFTPKTEEYVRKIGVKVIRTPGAGYVEDVKSAAGNVGLCSMIVLGADLPLIDGEAVDEVLNHYSKACKHALTVVSPLRDVLKIGLRPSCLIKHRGGTYVPCGVNVLDTGCMDEPFIEQEVMVTRDLRMMVNVNTRSDLAVAERLLLRRRSTQGRLTGGQREVRG